MSARRAKLNGKLRRRVRGQSTVEFALVMLFLLIPLLVVVEEAARIYSEQLAVVHAANVGARWATLSPQQQGCSGFRSLNEVIARDLGSRVQYQPPVTNTVILPTGTALEVAIPYQHTVLFPNIPVVHISPTLAFVAKSTMPVAAKASDYSAKVFARTEADRGQPGQMHIEARISDPQGLPAQNLTVTGTITCGACANIAELDMFSESATEPGYYISECSTEPFPDTNAEFSGVLSIQRSSGTLTCNSLMLQWNSTSSYSTCQ